MCDIAAGMTAHQAILQALFARTRSGEGRDIEVSLFHAMADWMNVPYLQYRYGGKAPRRMGLKHPTIAPYGAFECADGKAVLISIQNDREWRRLCSDFLAEPDLAAREGWATNSERLENRDAVDARVAKGFASLNREEAIKLLQRADIAFGRLSDLDDLIAHPQHRFISVSVNGKDVELLAPGAVVSGQEPLVAAVPSRDEQGTDIRAEFSQVRTGQIAGE